MASTIETQPPRLSAAGTHWWAICLVILATVLTSSAHVSLKYASGAFSMSFQGIVTNWPLWLSLALYIGAAVLLIAALSGGELSVIDPLQSASLIWTLCAARLLLGENASRRNIAGVAIILAGIIVLTSGRGGRKT